MQGWLWQEDFCPDWGWDCSFILKKRKEIWTNGGCVATCVAQIAMEAAFTGQQLEAANVVNEHLADKVLNTAN